MCFRAHLYNYKACSNKNLQFNRSFFVSLLKIFAMLSKQRVPDLIVIVVIGLFLILLNYTGNIGIMSDYPFIFLLIMYFVGRGVTWYVINKHMDDNENEDGRNIE